MPRRLIPEQFSRLPRALLFPGSLVHVDPESPLALEGGRLIHLTTSDPERIAVLEGPPLPHGAEPLHLVFFYGNAMTLDSAAWPFGVFRSLGCHVWIPDYVGYGRSTGTPGEQGCQATADAVYQHLTTTLGVPPSRLVLAGWSLGAAVAIDLATRHPAAGLLALSPFTSLRAMVRHLVPVPLPLHRLLGACFDNLSAIGGIRCPIFLSHGRRDPTIPFWMAEELVRALERQASALFDFVPLEGGAHDILAAPLLYEQLGQFLDRRVRAGGG